MMTQPTVTAPTIPVPDRAPTGRLPHIVGLVDAPPAYNPGDLHEIAPDPDEPTIVGGKVTIDNPRPDTPNGHIRVYAPVLYDQADLTPGEDRLHIRTWTVDAARLGKRISGPRTREQIEAWDEITRIVIDSDDPQALVDGFIERHAPCTVHSWCTDRGEHETHSGPVMELDCPRDEEDVTYLGANLFDIGDGKVIASFDAGQWVDLDAAGLRAEIAKVRAHCDRLDEMADQLAAIEAAR